MNMTPAVRAETMTIYQRVAELVCRPGTPKKTMDVLVRKALGDTPLWRVRACRLGEAGCFSAAAVRQLQEEFRLFLERHAARVAAADATEHARQLALDRDLLERCRLDHLAQLAAIERRLAALGPGRPDGA